MDSTEERLFVTVQAAARMLGYRRSNGYKLVKLGVIPVVRLGGGHMRVPVAKLRELVGELADGR